MSVPSRYAVIRVSPKRWQAARSWTYGTGRNGVMLQDWNTFGPRFADWRDAHDHAVEEMTPDERRFHARKDDE